MYEDLTVEDIKNDILKDLQGRVSVIEGSYTNNLISPIAFAIWRFYQSLDKLIPISFIDDTSGPYIDKRASEYGIYRKPGNKAVGVLKITGEPGTVIEQGTSFVNKKGLEFIAIETSEIGEKGNSQIEIRAIDIGSSYNLQPGSINEVNQSIDEVTGVTQEQVTTGGTEQESDTALMKRLSEFMGKRSTSGNIHDYEKWALETVGIGACKVIPLFNGNGTVKILVASEDKREVDSQTLEICINNIESKRPIGAKVSVVSAKALEIEVVANIIVENIVDTKTIVEEFEKLINGYFKASSFYDKEILYNRVAYLLLKIKGVIDFTSLSINDGVLNVTISDGEIPSLKKLEVTIAKRVNTTKVT